LANEKTPLRDTAPPTPQRAQTNVQRSAVARRRAIIGIVGAVVVIAALFFIFGGKDSPISIGPLGGSDAPVPQFTFNKVTTGAEGTVAGVDKKKQAKAAKDVAPDVQKTVTAVLQAGYIDPSSWGDAGAIKDYFIGSAADQVEPNIDTLTLGTDADKTYDSLDPKAGHMKVTALTDADPKAIRAMAEFVFTGTAALTDGTSAKVTVDGTFFLVPDGNSWKIEAFRIEREIKPKSPKASASTASASSSEST
jgi:hypothetical protein